MDQETILEKIIDFTDNAHGDQMRKYTPERYIVHPVRVMRICSEYSQALPVLAAAILHDVLEDTETGADEILSFLSNLMSYQQAKKTLKMVVDLTDVYTHSDYPNWNRDKRKGMEVKRLQKISADSQTIKYADIMDNTQEIVGHDPHFANKYLKECRTILLTIDKGNPELRKKALKIVNDALMQLNEH